MVFALSIHASYRCRHAGACCTSGWPIPVEADRLAVMRAAIATGALVSPRAIANGALFDAIDRAPGDAPADSPALLGVKDHACVFFDADHGRLCAVQRALGHDALPLACRQFPRVSLRDPRGVSVTLSHYCPTAASLLGSPEPVTIVRDAPAFPTSAEYSGLDATDALPPLLRPDVLMDLKSWWAWERASVDLIGNAARSAEDALARLETAVHEVSRWRPADGPLADRVRDVADRARARPAIEWRPSAEWLSARERIALEAIPRDLHAAIPNRASPAPALDPILLKQYLAAHAFANWTAWLGRGLTAWLRSIEVAYALVQLGWSVREADLLLRHLADPRQLASICSLDKPV
jgi:Fe-S-cluster containining protein